MTKETLSPPNTQSAKTIRRRIVGSQGSRSPSERDPTPSLRVPGETGLTPLVAPAGMTQDRGSPPYPEDVGGLGSHDEDGGMARGP